MKAIRPPRSPHQNITSIALHVLQSLAPFLIILFLTSQHTGLFLPAYAAKVSGHSSGTGSGESGGSTTSSAGEGDSALGDAAGNLASNAIQSWQWALIVMAIFGEALAVILALGSIKAIIVYTQKKGESRRMLGIEHGTKLDSSWIPTDDAFWNTSGAFCLFALIGLVGLAAYYPLFVLQQLMQARVISIGMDPFKTQILMFGLANLTNRFGDIGVACALLAVVRRRWKVHFPPFSTSSNAGQPEYSQGWWYNWKLCFDAAIALLMLIFGGVIASFECKEGTYFSRGKLIASSDMYHLYSALYYVITIDIVVSAFLLRGALVKVGIKDEVSSDYEYCPEKK